MLESIHTEILHIIAGMSLQQIALAYMGTAGFVCFLAFRKNR